MCGLFGAYSSFLTKNDRYDLRDLGILSMLRGTDSTGMIVGVRGKKAKMRYEVMKEPTDLMGFYRTPSVIKTLDSIANPILILGHTRAATIGSINKDNAHPFTCGHLIGMHNGTIHALGGKDKTDSQELYERIAEGGVKKALDSFSGNAAYALVWVDTYRDTLHFLRNKDRPLYFMITKGGGTMFYASERIFLDVLNQRSSSVFLPPESFPEDTLVTFQIGHMRPTLREVKREARTFFPINDKRAAANKIEELPFLVGSKKETSVPVVPPKPVLDDKWASQQQANAPVFDVKDVMTEPNKFDVATDIFPQIPVGGYPRKITIPCHNPAQPNQPLGRVQKMLWYMDARGIPMMPQTMEAILKRGCLISTTKANLTDVVYWLDNNTYVMPWHKNDDFVQEYLEGKKARRGYAVYATIPSAANFRKLRAEAAETSKHYTDTEKYEDAIVIVN